MAVNGVVAITKVNADGNVFNLSIISGIDAGVYVETRDLLLVEVSEKIPNARDLDKVLEALVFDITSPAGITVSIGLKQNLKDTTVWYGPYFIEESDKTIWLPSTLPESRFFRLRIEDPVGSNDWKLTRIEAYGHLAGGEI